MSSWTDIWRSCSKNANNKHISCLNVFSKYHTIKFKNFISRNRLRNIIAAQSNNCRGQTYIYYRKERLCRMRQVMRASRRAQEVREKDG